MDIKVNQLSKPMQVEQPAQQQQADGAFKFTLVSHIEVKDFLNEIVNRSHSFSRENFLDKRGRHRVYGIVRLVDAKLDELAQELVKDEKDNLNILSKIGEIRGLLLDIFT